jgi:4'-phosphopantetheinyl transferase
VIAVPDADVHIWWLSLESAEPDVERAGLLLSAEERARAGRYHFARDRRRFVLARAFLRTLLAEYTGEKPDRVSLRYSPAGKPFLANRSELQFNLSHSGDRGVLAVTSRPVGADLEKIRHIPEALAIAEHLFTTPEMRALRAYPESERSEAFLRCWTRKEAYVKARGGGLSTPLDSFHVTLDRGSAELTLLEEHGAQEWKLYDVEAGPGWAAALAVDRESARLVHHTWP